MTQWIDDLVYKLESPEKDAHLAYLRERERQRLIVEQGPAFFRTLGREIEAQVQELNDKVGGVFGGVRVSRSETQITIRSGNGERSLVIRARMKECMFVSDMTRAHPKLPEVALHHDFGLSANANTGVVSAISEHGGYTDCAAIATLLLRETFGR